MVIELILQVPFMRILGNLAFVDTGIMTYIALETSTSEVIGCSLAASASRGRLRFNFRTRLSS